jgi:hypothetical protein
LVAEHMPQLYDRLLRPLGVPDIPDSIPAAVEAFIARRNVLEHEYNLNVDRALENEVRQGIARVL